MIQIISGDCQNSPGSKTLDRIGILFHLANRVFKAVFIKVSIIFIKAGTEFKLFSHFKHMCICLGTDKTKEKIGKQLGF